MHINPAPKSLQSPTMNIFSRSILLLLLQAGYSRYLLQLVDLLWFFFPLSYSVEFSPIVCHFHRAAAAASSSSVTRHIFVRIIIIRYLLQHRVNESKCIRNSSLNPCREFTKTFTPCHIDAHVFISFWFFFFFLNNIIDNVQTAGLCEDDHRSIQYL